MPVARRRAQALVGFLGCRRAGAVARPRQRADRLLAVLEQVARARTAAFDSEREVCLETEARVAAARVGRVASTVDEAPAGGRRAVVERRLAGQLELNGAADALGRAYEHVV